MTDADHLWEPISGCFVYLLLGMAQTIFIYPHPTEHQLNLGISWRGLIKRLRHQTVKISKKVLTKKGQRIIYEHKKKMRLRQLKSLRISIQLFNAFDVWISLKHRVARKTFNGAKVIAEANLGPWAAGLPMQGYSMWASRRSYRCSNLVVMGRVTFKIYGYGIEKVDQEKTWKNSIKLTISMVSHGHIPSSPDSFQITPSLVHWKHPTAMPLEEGVYPSASGGVEVLQCFRACATG